MSYPWNQRGQDTHHIGRGAHDDQSQRRPPAREQRNSSYAQASGSGTSYNSRNSALDYCPPNGGPSGGARVARSLATSPRFDGHHDDQTSMNLTEEWVTNERRMQHYRMNGYLDVDGDGDSEASTGSRTLYPTSSEYTCYIFLLISNTFLPGPQANYSTSSIPFDRRSSSRPDYQRQSVASTIPSRRHRGPPASSGSSTSSSPGTVSPTPPIRITAEQIHYARLPTELYSLIASFALSERPIAKIHTFRKSPWREIEGASLASRALREAILRAWFRVLRIRQVGDFNYIDSKLPFLFPWVREIHWHYRFPITCNETHVLPKFIHAVLVSFKTSDNRLGNEHYMTMVHKALPYLGSLRSLTRLSVTCRSLLDIAFLSALSDWWPGLECLRLARPLKDDTDTKAFALYKYEFSHWEEVVQRLVSCLAPPLDGAGGLQRLSYLALDLSFCDFREMRLCHAMQGPGAQVPDWVVLPNSLRMYGPRGRQELEDLNAPGLEEEDGDESMDGGMLEEDVEMAEEEDVMVGLPWSPHGHGNPPHFVQQHFVLPQQQQQPMPYHHSHHPSLHPNTNTQSQYQHQHQHQHQQFHHSSSQTAPLQWQHLIPPPPAPPPLPPAASLYPNTHTATPDHLTCLFCRRSFRAQSFWFEQQIALALARAFPALGAVRFRACFSEEARDEARENKWLVKRVGGVTNGGTGGSGVVSVTGSPFTHGGGEVVSGELVEVVAPRWD